MGSSTLDKANDAATGDVGAAKWLVMAFSVVALIGGIAIGAFYSLGKGLGNSARETITDATESVTESAENAASGGWGS